MKKGFIFLCLLALVIIAIFIFLPKKNVVAPTHDVRSFRDAAYVVDGKTITLKDGIAEESIPGSSLKIRTSYFGNEAKGDLDGDGREDVAFLLTQSGGGSGTFFFLAVALKTDMGYKGSNSIFLGDRIAPQPTQIKNGVITVNYADRLPGEPFSAQPSQGVSRYFKMENDKLVEIKGEMGD